MAEGILRFVVAVLMFVYGFSRSAAGRRQFDKVGSTIERVSSSAYFLGGFIGIAADLLHPGPHDSDEAP